MKPSEIITEFAGLLGEPLNRLVGKTREEGRRAIGYTCSYVPAPLLGVEGLVPVSVRAPGVSGTPMADTYMSSVTCSYTRSLLESAIDGAYSALDGWVFTASCDHLRRLYDNLEYLDKPAFNYIVDLPHKTGAPAVEWFTQELRSLAADLSEHFGVDTGPEALRRSIDIHNECNALLGAVSELRKKDNPPISGADYQTLVTAVSASPRDMLLERLREIKSHLESTAGVENFRARLMLAGSRIDDPGYIRIIESQGGIVVADRFCSGSIPGLEPVAAGDDPLSSLAAHYLEKTPCPRMMEEFSRRLEDTLDAAREFRVDGIIVQTMKFCDCWGVESSPLVTALREAGCPVLRLEREYALTGEGQLRTRIQAFLESMGK